MKTIPMELTQREAALIQVCRSMRHGTLEKIAVTEGQPEVIVVAVQRIDLKRENEREACLRLPVDFDIQDVQEQGDQESSAEVSGEQSGLTVESE